MKENRKIAIEVLDDGTSILSVNFDQNGVRHPMTIVGAYESYRKASDVACELQHEADWVTEFMGSDGSVPIKRSALKWDTSPSDDIPF